MLTFEQWWDFALQCVTFFGLDFVTRFSIFPMIKIRRHFIIWLEHFIWWRGSEKQWWRVAKMLSHKSKQGQYRVGKMPKLLSWCQIRGVELRHSYALDDLEDGRAADNEYEEGEEPGSHLQITIKITKKQVFLITGYFSWSGFVDLGTLPRAVMFFLNKCQ